MLSRPDPTKALTGSFPLSSLIRLVPEILIIALVLAAMPLFGEETRGQSSVDQTTWIDRLSPGVFDGSGRPAVARRGVRYQVNATVLIPLLITSIPIVNRDDVGVGSFTVADFEDGDDGPLRAYEFFAASIPDRARGLNRLGFVREVSKLSGGGPQWTAQFGVISADRAESRAEAEASFEQDQSLQPYKIINAIIRPQQTRDTVTTLNVEGHWESADALYADVTSLAATVPPDASHELGNPGRQVYDQPVGFLGAIQHTLRHVAAALAAGNEPDRISYPYIHKGEVFKMEFREHAVDRRRHADYLEAGLVESGAVVHWLEYRVMNDRGDEEESFELWTELPTEDPSDPLSPPILPIAFEFKPRAYLELKAVQIPTIR